jgi:putative DNA primase/helicase
MSLHRDAAMTYAGRGWRVVPSHEVVDLPGGGTGCTCRDGPACGKAGKHPRVSAWQEVATTDPATVDAWWTEWPDANVSVVLGAVTGMWAVDVDGRSGGFGSASEYEARSQFGFPRTLKATTGSGGWHLFYRVPPGVVVRNSTSILPGIDVRGEGGQVVAPPSRHKSGGFYTWSDCWDEGPQDAPEELIRLVTERDDGSRDGGGGGRWSTGLPPASEILQGVPEGERNDTLFRWACQLRRQLRDDRSAVETLVREAARASGLGQDEVNLILTSAFRQDHDDDGPAGYGMDGLTAAQVSWADAHGRPGSPNPSVGGTGRRGAEEPPGGLSGETGTLRFPLTDLGNAWRLATVAAGDLRYVKQWGEWVMWDGRRWARCDHLEERLAMHEAAAGVWREVADVADPEVAKQVRGWARTSQMQGKIDAGLRAAQPLLVASSDDLDADDWLLTTRSGTLDLRNGVLREHSRDDLLTLMVDTAYDPEARCPRWEAFVEMILPDPAVRWFLQKAAGYSLTGATDAKAMMILWGSGNNGKSVLIEALRENAYGELAGVAPKTLLMATRDEHATQLAGVAGKRFVTLSEEVEERDKLRSATLKAVTGGDTMTARFMRQDFFEFRPKLKLWVATNHRPGVTDFGEAMRSRLRLVPFTVAIPPEVRRDRESVLEEFRQEAPGILAWCVKGLAGYLHERLEPPSAVEAEVNEWLDDEDVVGQWLKSCVHPVGDGRWTKTSDLHAAYATWMTLRGEEKFVVSPKSLGRRLASSGYDRVPGKVKGWRVVVMNEENVVL